MYSKGGQFYDYEVPTNPIWDINKVDLNWKKVNNLIEFSTKNSRILPDEHQAFDLNTHPHSIIIVDDLICPDALEALRNEYHKIHGEYSATFNIRNNSVTPSKYKKIVHTSKSKDSSGLGIHDALQCVTEQVWDYGKNILLKNGYEGIHHIDSWINKGKLKGSAKGMYHFMHYDCDEYLEFSKDLFRFPACAAVLFLKVEENSHKTYFPDFDQSITPKTGRVVFFDARYLHGVFLNKLQKLEDERIVMVSNLWDYPTRSEQIETTHGVTGFTRGLKDGIEYTKENP
jgi:hypothetical protein